MKNIKLTDFVKRHFDKNFNGTKISNFSIVDFEKQIEENSFVYLSLINQLTDKHSVIDYDDYDDINIQVMNGYAPFCKLVAIRNFTDAKVGSMPITLENYQYLRSGYSARRDTELPVLSRWFDLPLSAPKADYLILILYSKEQIDKEEKIECEKDGREFIPFDANWGIVSINGQSHPDEEPMPPATMLRNALGIEFGGSGVELDTEDYMKSVEFWNNNAIIK